VDLVPRGECAADLLNRVAVLGDQQHLTGPDVHAEQRGVVARLETEIAARALADPQLVDHHLRLGEPAHARHQRGEVDRLGHEVVGAGLICRHAVFGSVERRHHHHGQMRRRGHRLDPPADLEPVDARHQRVDEHEIRLGLADQRERLHAVARDDHVQVLGRELGLEQGHTARRVVDQENASTHGGSRLLIGADRPWLERCVRVVTHAELPVQWLACGASCGRIAADDYSNRYPAISARSSRSRRSAAARSGPTWTFWLAV
jgi:hypothetical protein